MTYVPPEPPPDEYDIEPPEDAGQLRLFDPPPAPVPLDAGFVCQELHHDDGQPAGWEVGCQRLVVNEHTGNLDGVYLPIQQFAGETPAWDLLDRLYDYAESQRLLTAELPDLAEKAAGRIVARESRELPAWRVMTDDELLPYRRAFGFVLLDEPPDPLHDELRHAAWTLSGLPNPAVQALDDLGLEAAYDPGPPPFYDAATGTAYWIGVYQPDPADRRLGVTSILSLAYDEELGAYQAQLAPCLAGDWDAAWRASEHLLGIAARSGDIERVFEAAEGMALAGHQWDLWQDERGLPLDPASAHELGAAAWTWEVER